MARVEIDTVSKSFGTTQVLREVSLSLAEGELVSLLGHSGCGKTTLLRILAGFELPDHGRVRVNGEDITDLPSNRRGMGMVFQAYSLFPNMTARENVAFGLRVRGVSRTERLKRADAMLDRVGLAALGARYPRQLSGGQQQRVALARALAIAPRMLLLDEPLSALDAKVRVQLREEIRRVQRETGITTVFVTHDQEEALSISDRVAVMHEGRILQADAPAMLYRAPADGIVARFVGVAATFAGRAEAGGVRCGGVLLPAADAANFAPGGVVELFLRPEHVTLAALGTAAGLPARVQDLTFLGATTRVRVVLDALCEPALIADLPSAAADGLLPGTAVLACWDAQAPRVLGA